jgi:hypothetical protein
MGRVSSLTISSAIPHRAVDKAVLTFSSHSLHHDNTHYRPPLEMRKSKGIVKVRAMRISEDGTRFREFAWAQSDDKNVRSVRGTITLSLHLCHFAEATNDVTPATNAQIPDKSNMTGDDGLHNDEMTHPVLAPPTARPQGSKLWTWYWRDEEPRAVFQFTYATKEALQAEGIIPLTSKPISHT